MPLTTPSTDQERRRFLRIQFDGITELVIEQQSYTVELLDLSLKGALVKSEPLLPCQPDSPFQMYIHLAADDLTLVFNTSLIRMVNNNYGLRFNTIDLDTLTHLRRIMELNLGDENLLERELDHLFPLS